MDGKSPRGNPLDLGFFLFFKTDVQADVHVLLSNGSGKVRRLRKQSKTQTERKKVLNGAEDHSGEAE